MVEAARVIWREGEQVRVEFYARTDGLFTFAGWTLRRDDHPLGEPYFYGYPTYQSGFHASEAEAEDEARAVVPWLRAAQDD